MPGRSCPAPRGNIISDHSHHDDDDDGENQEGNHNPSNRSRPTRWLTQDQIIKEKHRLYQAQRNGNWLTLKNQLPLLSTKSFGLDDYGNVEWVRRKDGTTVWLMRIEALGQQGKAKVWFILKDAYMEW